MLRFFYSKSFFALIFIVFWWSFWIFSTIFFTSPTVTSVTKPQVTPERTKMVQILSGDIEVLAGEVMASPQMKKRFEEIYQKLLPSPRSLPKPDFVYCQTEASALMCLSLGARDRISAYPKRLKIFQELVFSEKSLAMTESLQEELFKISPDVVFVSSYSNPRFLEGVSRLSLPLVFLGDQKTLQDMEEDLKKMAEILHKPFQGALLLSYIGSQLERLAFDLKSVDTSLCGVLWEQGGIKPIYPSTVLYHWLKEQGFVVDFSFQLTREEMESAKNPYWVILRDFSALQIEEEFFLKKGNTVLYVDQKWADSPSPWILLALYDFVHGVIDAHPL